MAHIAADCVYQEATVSGYGAAILGAALTGFKSITDVAYDGDTFVYEIHAVDANGVRTGEWEIGLGRYDPNVGNPPAVMRRWFVIAVSTTFNKWPATVDSFLNFTTGTVHLMLCNSAAYFDGGLIKAWYQNTGRPEFYVDKSGEDAHTSNNRYFLTVQAAVNVAALFADSKVSFSSSGGDWSTEVAVVSSGATMEISTLATLGEVLIQGVSAQDGSKCSVRNVSLTYTDASGKNSYIHVDNVIYRASGGSHITVDLGGEAQLRDYTIAGGAPEHVNMTYGANSSVTFDGTTTFSANAAFANGFVVARGPCFIDAEYFSLDNGGFTITGKRYNLIGCAVCDTKGQATTLFPGSVAGTVASGAVYY